MRSLALVREPRALGEFVGRDLELVAPHRIFVLPFSAAADGGLSSAVFVGWRFLLAARAKIIGSVEVLDDEESSVAVTTGPFGPSTEPVIDQLAAMTDLEDGDHELRLLKINALYVVAAWVVGDHQLIIPLQPAPSFIRAGKVYSERAFLDSLLQPGVRPFSLGP